MNSRPQYDRPTRVSVICYLLLGAAAGELGRALMLGYFPRIGFAPIAPNLFIIDLAHGMILGLCAYYMLHGANWARITFYILAVVNVAGLLKIHFGLEIVAAIAELIIAGAILATPRPNRFFAGKDPNIRKLKPSEIPAAGRVREGQYDY
jgi:hypothetical protein